MSWDAYHKFRRELFRVLRYAPHKEQEAFHASTAQVRLLAGGERGGKAMDINTLVPTPDGWKTMGALKAGDWVFGESILPPQIRKAYEFGKAAYQVYEWYKNPVAYPEVDLGGEWGPVCGPVFSTNRGPYRWYPSGQNFCGLGMQARNVPRISSLD